MTDPAEKDDAQPQGAQPQGFDQQAAPETAAPGNPAVDGALIAELEKKLLDANDRMLRAMAEADNTRKRLEKERLDTAKFAVSSFAKDLLTVADNLRRAIAAITPEQRDASPEFKNIAIGVEATERELLGIFERNGIRKVDPAGQKFDPNLHEVIFEAESADKPPGTVIQVIEPGYTLHDRLLRPARVGVAKGGAQSAPILDEQV